MPFANIALQAFITPLQGFFNVMVYLRPKYIAYCNKYPEMSTFGLIANAVRWSPPARRLSKFGASLQSSVRWSTSGSLVVSNRSSIIRRWSTATNMEEGKSKGERANASGGQRVSFALSTHSSVGQQMEDPVSTSNVKHSTERRSSSTESIPSVTEEENFEIDDVEEGKKWESIPSATEEEEKVEIEDVEEGKKDSLQG